MNETREYVWNLPYYDSFADEWTDEEYDDFNIKYNPIVEKMNNKQYNVLLLWLYDGDMPLVFGELIEDASELTDEECIEIFKEYLFDESHAWLRDDFLCEGDDLYERICNFVKEGENHGINK